MATLEMGDKYLRTILGFLGITDMATIAAEGLDVVGADIDGVVNNAIKQAQDMAVSF